MVTVNDIGTQPPAYVGEPPKGITWAAVRAPIWNRTGFKPNPVISSFPPSSNNWSPAARPDFDAPFPFHDARYMEDLTSLRKAFPVSLQLSSAESPSGAYSTSLGVYSESTGSGSFDLYLALGVGIALGGFYNFRVYNYWPFNPSPPNVPTTGYDFETTKAHLLGATVNLSITTYTSTFTASVVITPALFTADLSDSSSKGIFITTTSDGVIDFYISSVVLP